MCVQASLKLTIMKSIIKQIRRLSFEKRHSIMVRQDTLDKINKLTGAVMYHNATRVSKSDIIAHAVDYLYKNVMQEMAKLNL